MLWSTSICFSSLLGSAIGSSYWFAILRTGLCLVGGGLLRATRFLILIGDICSYSVCSDYLKNSNTFDLPQVKLFLLLSYSGTNELLLDSFPRLAGRFVFFNIDFGSSWIFDSLWFSAVC